jgi:hypothetical protein
MAAGNTYEAIATQTLGSAAASVTFSSIPGTYTDLVIVCTPLRVTAGAEELVFQFNSDTGSNYSSTILTGDGSTASSIRFSNQTYANMNYNSNVSQTQSVQIYSLMNYSNTTTFKTFIGRANRADSGVETAVALWRSTAAVTSIAAKLKNGNNFATGSTFSLYGILAA